VTSAKQIGPTILTSSASSSHWSAVHARLFSIFRSRAATARAYPPEPRDRASPLQISSTHAELLHLHLANPQRLLYSVLGIAAVCSASRTRPPVRHRRSTFLDLVGLFYRRALPAIRLYIGKFRTTLSITPIVPRSAPS
jgi:hypothetical protein